MPLELMLRRMRDKTVQDHTELPVRTPGKTPRALVSPQLCYLCVEAALVFQYRHGLQREGVSVMNLSDMVGRKQTPEGNGPLHERTASPPDYKIDFTNMRRVQPEESLTKKVLSPQASHAAEYEHGVDYLIRGLVDLLPKHDSIWPLDDRAKWLRLAVGIFDLGYKAGDGEHGDIRVVFVKQQAAS